MGPHAISHQHHAAAHRAAEIAHFEHDAIQEEIDVVVAQGTAVELVDGLLQLAGDVGNGLRGIGFAEHRLQHLAHLASGNAAQKGLQDEIVDGLLAPLIARDKLRTEPFARARNLQAAKQPELGDQIAKVEAVAEIATGQRSMLVVAQVHMAVAFGQQGLFDEPFELSARHFRQILLQQPLAFG